MSNHRPRGGHPFMSRALQKRFQTVVENREEGQAGIMEGLEELPPELSSVRYKGSDMSEETVTNKKPKLIPAPLKKK